MVSRDCLTQTSWYVRLLLFLVAVLTGIGWPGIAVPALGNSSPKLEYRVKAAFLLNFAKFVQWPAEAFRDDETPITIGVLGRDPFGRTLEQAVHDKTVHGREVDVIRFSTVDNLTACHILFISLPERERLPDVLAATEGSATLTVGETERFARNGGIINFIMRENKVRFEINVDAAARSGLRISSKLLKLATIVRD